MTIYTGWDVQIGGYGSTSGSSSVTSYNVPADAIDFTSRVKSLKVDNQAYLGKVGRTTAQVVLDNNDGALTPEGGGTYASKDWFAEPLHVIGRIGTSDPPAIQTGATSINPYFSGPINDFKFHDDGFESTVILTAVDWGSFFSRFTFQAAATEAGNLNTVYANLSDDMRPYLPLYGADVGSTNWSALGGTTANLSQTVAKGDYLGDVSNTLIAADGGTLLPPITTWLWSTSGGGQKTVRYDGYLILRDNLTVTAPLDYPLVFNGTNSLASTDLPIKNLKLAFNDDEFITQAEVNRTGGTAQYSFNNTGSTTWGPKSVTITDIPLTSDADSLSYAQWFTNRFDQVNFVPSSFEITGSMIENKCNDAALEYVKYLTYVVGNSIRSVLWRPLKIMWTGAGNTSNTKNVLANRVTLIATPTDWKIKFQTVDAVTNGAFILNSTTQGILNTNKLG
jgi:hypothetical protein